MLTPWFTQTADGTMYWLGTDDRGRDILSRLIWGSRLVLFWSGLATIVAYIVGMMLGVTAGYRGGWWDEVISFFGNVLLSFPLMVLYLVILSRFGPTSELGRYLALNVGLSPTAVSGVIIIVAVTFGTAPQVARIVRGLVLDLKTRDYIAAAEVRGERPLYIMVVELLPNARGPLIVDACLRLGYVTITIALLGYLALGLPPPDPDWGKMISDAQKFGSFGMNAMLWPAFAISSLVLGLNLLADGLREISLRD
jgi:peptide/nickel transport system permease protein